MLDQLQARSSAPLTQRTKEILFLDARIENHALLSAGVRPGIEVISLRADLAGMAQISATLAGRSDIAAVHLVGHGAPGQLELGLDRLNADAIANGQHHLQRWCSALNDQAEILIYGCQTALGTAGERLLGVLAKATGATIAASSTIVGHASLGGGWSLDRHTGPVRTSLAFVPHVLHEYPETLATFTVINGNDSGAGSLREAIADANALAGADEIQFQDVASVDLTTAELAITDELTIIPHLSLSVT